MKLSARNRWIFYGAAGFATAAAIWWVNTREPDADVVQAVASAPAPAPTSSTADAPTREGTPQLRSIPSDARHGAPPTTDPFGSPQWEVRAALRNVAPAPVRPAPPVAPPVPFVYMGRWMEDGKVLAILDRQGQPSFVKVHDTVDGTYRVESIDETQLVLTYLPMRLRQTLGAGDDPQTGATAATPSTHASTAGGSGSSGDGDSSD